MSAKEKALLSSTQCKEPASAQRFRDVLFECSTKKDDIVVLRRSGHLSSLPKFLKLSSHLFKTISHSQERSYLWCDPVSSTLFLLPGLSIQTQVEEETIPSFPLPCDRDTPG
ncbi:uncharacterized protein WM277_021787 isoform 1-T1 [Molossus nigricans]